ncbi:MAG: class II glutamine amidotransferase [Rhodospirillaceae bacterium]
MCELFGMSANVPTDICFSFAGLMRRGGETGPHRDGWGVAFYEDKGCRTFHDPRASADSEIARLVRSHAIQSELVICHIRKATHGRVCLENTHPFTRELWGHQWAFAHNGKLPGVKKRPLSFFRPIGTTDSEHAFCWLLDQVRLAHPGPRFPRTGLEPLIRDLTADLGSLGIFNMLLSDARHLYCRCSTNLAWLTRHAPFGTATLIDEDLTVDFDRRTSPGDVVTVIATKPLTRDEPWITLAPGSFVTFRQGRHLVPSGRSR